jgi:F-type H+-transporting ATPase subunit gamma
MATQQDIARRIRSVRNTGKITKAMELVAASRLRRAQARVQGLRPYADRMQQLTVEVAAATALATGQPLLEKRELKGVAVLALTADRGLAGGFNANVIRRSLAIASEHRGAGRDVHWVVVGRKGGSSLRFRGQTVADAYTGITDRPQYADARAIAARVAELYTDGEVDQVVMVYNRFVSALTQQLETLEVLPVPDRAVSGEEPELIEGAYLEEPDRSEILRHLLPTYVEVTIYRAPA